MTRDTSRTAGDTPFELALEMEEYARSGAAPDPAVLREWARIVRQFKRVPARKRGA